MKFEDRAQLTWSKAKCYFEILDRNSFKNAFDQTTQKQNPLILKEYKEAR